MVDWSGTTSWSFDVFQNLPELVREALVYEAGRNDTAYDWNERDITSYIISRYDMNQSMTIGSLTSKADEFLEWYTNRRMVVCYMDNQCNMVLAKLAWREDY